MDITKETKLKELLTEYPWLKEEIVKGNDKFKMMNTPMGKIMIGKADISEMSRKSGMEADVIISDGNLTVYQADDDEKLLSTGESIVSETDIPVGMKTNTGIVYTEIAIRREDIMNEAIKAGENFHFAKGGLHSIKAKKKFQMGLLLTLS